MLNIVVPMAGEGSRFAKVGYSDPKPLIPIYGVPMIEVIVNNLKPKMEHRFIFIVRKHHAEKYNLKEKLTAIAGTKTVVIEIDKLTEGAAVTVLMAKEFINNTNPLMIANSDQFVDVDINAYLAKMESEKSDGYIMTMKANDNKWSFIGFDQNHKINKVVEKEVISDEATVGIYNFKHGGDFVQAAEQMISQNLRVNNEFYVAPVYNTLIEQNKNIGYFNIGSLNNGMYGIGVPEDLNTFLDNPISFKAIENIKNNGRFLSVIVPLWNEAGNLPALVKMFDESPLVKLPVEIILVSNGSTDKTGEILKELSTSRPWIKPLYLEVNQNYGGGISSGFKKAVGTFIGFMPGDLQVHCDDMIKVAKVAAVELSKGNTSTLVKGYRNIRKDGWQTKFVSRVYTVLANLILGIWVKDINGLPKVFHRGILEKLNSHLFKTFVLDAQILATAKHLSWNIVEVPVTFHARREGISSWSGKRMKVYLESFKSLFRIRFLKLYKN